MRSKSLGLKWKEYIQYKILETSLGPMIALSDEKGLSYLTFIDYDLEATLKELGKKTKALLISQETPFLISIESELKEYFAGRLTRFDTPLSLYGTPFQRAVWEELKKIPFGKTCSYSTLAQEMGHPRAFRAAAQANGANPLPIIIPCHRVINSNGKLGGYSAGLARKEWLLHHEGKISR